jgi:hypothetical protein
MIAVTYTYENEDVRVVFSGDDNGEIEFPNVENVRVEELSILGVDKVELTALPEALQAAILALADHADWEPVDSSEMDDIDD